MRPVNRVIAVVAVVSVDVQLIDHLKAVLAPVPDVDQGVVERRAVVALKAVALTQSVRGGEHVRSGDLLQQALKLGIG